MKLRNSLDMPLARLEETEHENSGTSWTRNEDFDKNGYLLIKDLWDPIELYRPVPSVRGKFDYWGRELDQYEIKDQDDQVPGSLSVYGHPQYRMIHTQVRLKLEKIIGRKLYNTYYYDRFYFDAQELTPHTDRDACEISVSVHVGTNLEECWPFRIKSCSGQNRSLCLDPGDGLLYKGCERPHWRDEIPSRIKKRGGIFSKFRKEEEEDVTYYHQIFFHYVLADGIRCHHASDLMR